MDNKHELKKLWEDIFSHEQSESTPENLVRHEQQWREQRCVHLPLTLEVMLENFASLEYGRRGQADGERVLLLMVGFSEEQLALSIAAHVQRGCKKIVPFSSLDVWTDMQSKVVDCLHNLSLSKDKDYWFESLQKIKPNDPADVFRKIMHWVRENPTKQAAVECTGGKKPMDAGSAYAASFYGLPAYYLDFDEYDPQLRKPWPWACRYHRLSLPEAAFSLATRQEVLNLFKARRFAEGQALLKQILEAPHSEEYLEKIDWQDLEQAEKFLYRCDCWMHLRYNEQSLDDHKLHPYFMDAYQKSLKPRAVIETLLQRDHFNLLSEYIVDEYWRLWSLWEMQEFREVLIGCVGLVELITDALYYFAWFDSVKITEIVPQQWFNNESSDLPDSTQLSWQLINPSRLPPANYTPKVVLLKKGMGKFKIWTRPDEMKAEKLNPPGLDFNDPRLEAEVTLKTDSPSLQFKESKTKMEKLWKKCWGNYPNGSWVEARHSLVHMRTPAFLDKELMKSLKDVIEQVLPKFIELLFRLSVNNQVDITDSADPKWITWNTQDRWKRNKRVPWAGQEVKIAQLIRLKI